MGGRLGISFAAGFVSVVLPCVLPLVPGYLAALSSVEAGQFESPFAGHGASGETFAAALHTSDENAFGRNETEALAFRSEGAFALGDPVAKASEPGDVSEGSFAPDGFKQAVATKHFPFGVQYGVE